MNQDHFARLRSEPELARTCVSEALREMMRWRRGGGARPTSAQFVAAALAALPTTRWINVQERRRLRALVERDARRFIGSPIGTRLMTVDIDRIVAVPKRAAGADVVVRDRRGSLHAIGITMVDEPLHASVHAAQIAKELRISAADSLSIVHVHLFSLAAGRRFLFDRQPQQTCHASVVRVA